MARKLSWLLLLGMGIVGMGPLSPLAANSPFVRGDVDGSGGLAISDAVSLLSHLYRGGPAPACLDAADADDDGVLGLTDATAILHHLFQGGAPLPSPYPECGADPTSDALDCKDSACPDLEAGEAALFARSTSRESRALPGRSRRLGTGGSLISLGEVVSGEIRTLNQTDSYQFEAAPGQWIVADRIATTNAAGLNWKLEDSWGRVLASNLSALDDLGPVALLGGLYTLIVLPEGSGTGAYSFRLMDAAPVETAISIGDRVQGAIDADHPGQRRRFHFSAPAGQAIFLDDISAGFLPLNWRLEDSRGRVLLAASRIADQGPITLQGGSYHLIIEGFLSGGNLTSAAFDFLIAGVPSSPARAIALGEVVSGAISAQGESDSFTFTAAPGQSIFLDQISSTNAGSMGWELTDHLARTVLARTTSVVDTGPLSLAGGDYSLRILPEGANVGSYSFRVVEVSKTVGSISIGQEVAGEILADRPGSVNFYEFTSPPSRLVTLELIQSSNSGSLDWLLEDALGRAVLARTTSLSTAGPIALLGGPYRLSILGEGGSTGTYRFRVRDDGAAGSAAAGAPAAVGDLIESNLAAPGGEARYTFTAVAGQTVYLDLLLGHNDLDWSLIDGVGAALGSLRANNTDLSDIGPLTLTAGSYTVVLKARTAAAAPAFRFQIAGAAPVDLAATVGDLISGDFAGLPGTVHRYQLAATEGQSVFLDRLIISSRLAWSLIDPSGQPVFALVRADGVDNDQGPFTLAAGTYTLVLDPEYGYQPAYQIAIRAAADEESAATPGDVIAGSFAGKAGAKRTVVLDVAEGTKLFFDRRSATARIDWSLVDPVGTEVFGPVRFDNGEGDEGPFALGAGTYRLVLDPQVGYEPSYDIQVVQVNDLSTPLPLGSPVAGALGIGGTATYGFEAFEGQRVFFDLTTGANTLRWSLLDELDEAVFLDASATSATTDQGPLNIGHGSYRLVFDATGSNTPAYAFSALSIAVDLSIAELAASPRVIFEGDTERKVEVTWTVENLGGGPAPTGAWTDRLTFSSDSTLGNTDDVVLEEFVRFDTLEPRSSYSRRETVKLPAGLLVGQRRIFLSVDSAAVHTEPGAEANNLSSIEVAVAADLPPAEPEFIATTTFPIDFTAAGVGKSVDIPLARPVSLDSIRYVHAEAASLELSGPARGDTQSDVTMSLLSGKEEVVEVSTSSPYTGQGLATFVTRFSRRLTPQVVALLSSRTIDGVRFRFEQASSTSTRLRSIHADGRLRVYFAGCEFAPCGPHLERRSTETETVTFVGTGASEWRTVTFDEAVPGDGLRFVSGPRFTATVLVGLGIGFASSEVQLILDNGALVTLDDSRSPSTLKMPATFWISADNSLSLSPSQLAGRQILGFQWRVQGGSVGLGSATLIYTPQDEFAVRFLYEAEACRGSIAIPPVELSPPDGSAFAPGSAVVVSGRALAPQAGREVSAVLVNGEPVDSLDAAGRFFKTVMIREGENSVVVQVVEPGCGEYESILRLLGITGGASGLEGYTEATAQLQVEYADTTFLRSESALVVRARVRNASAHPVRGPILMALTGLSPISASLRGPAGLTESGEPFTVLLEGGTLDPGAAGSYVSLVFSNPDRLPVRYGVRWLVPADRPPHFESSPNPNAVVGKPYRYAPLASDPDGDPVVLELERAPTGMTLDGSGVLAWTPNAGDLGAHDVSLAAVAAGARGTQRWTLTVSATSTNRPPYFTSIPVTGAAVGSEYVYEADALDPESDPLVYSLRAGPAGMAIEAQTGRVAWEPALPGEHAVSVAALDQKGGEAVQSFLLAVGSLPSNPSAPRITSSPSTEARAGILYIYQAVASDPDGDLLQFSLAASPSGMTLDAARGRIQWTPALDQVGTHAVSLRVQDGRGGETAQGFEIAVREGDANLAPMIESAPGGFAPAGKPYRYDVDAIDPEGEAIRYALASGPLGMTIDGATGLLEWTPPANAAASQVVAVEALDPKGAAGRQAFELRVRASNAAPRMTKPPASLTVTAGQVYQVDVDAEDSDGDLLRYEMASGPAGMTVYAVTGLLTWRTAPGDVGQHAAAVRVVDGFGGQVEASFTVTVVPDTEPPEVIIGFKPSPAPVGSIVEVSVSASDDVSIAAKTLTVECAPDPLREIALDETGRASFASPRSGYCIFKATATDPSGNTGTATQALQVGNPDDPLDSDPPVVTVLEPAPGSVITALTNVVGTISDATEDGKPGSGPVTWTVEIAPSESATFETIGSGSGEVVNTLLAKLDPTLKPNGVYKLRITGNDGVQTGGIEYEVSIAGELKLGDLTLEYVDLVVPVGGIPIVVTRRYSSFDTSPGEFGAGWRLGLPGRVEDSARESNTGNGLVDLLSSEPFKPGTRVYVTLPDGRRAGFTFEPLNAGGFLSFANNPFFRPDPGVLDKLEVVEPAGAFFLFNGAASQVGVPYNPSKYRLVTKSGLSYTIDERAGLERVDDLNGNTLEVRRDGVFSSAGPSIAFERDASGRINRIIDPDGGEIGYTFDAAGDLVAVTDQTGSASTYSYHASPPHHLKDVVEPNGRRSLRAEYDANGRLISTTDALGNAITLTIDPGARTETTRDALGHGTMVIYDERGNPISAVDPLGAAASARYDENQNRISYTDPRGSTTTAEYDSRGNMTRFTDALGGSWTGTYDEGNRITSLVDPHGNATSYQYDAQGNPVAITDPLGGTSRFSYDSQGRKLTETDPLGGVTRFVYGELSLPIEVTRSDGSVRALEYDGRGLLSRLVDENGSESTFTYDAAGRLLSTRDAAGGETVLEYSGDLVSSRKDPLGNITRYEYDAAGRRTKTIEPTGAATARAYDANGRLSAETHPQGGTSAYAYRADGRLASIADALGRTVSTAYDETGNLTSYTSETGLTTSYEIDVLGRLERETDPLRGTRSYTHDAAGRRLSATDKNGNTTRYAYDGLGRKIQETDGLGNVTSFGYDAKGNLVSVAKPGGSVTRFEYDSRGRLTRRTGPEGFSQTFAYDQLSNITASTDEAGNVTRREFDFAGRLLSVTDPLGGVVRYSYDGLGNRTSVTDPLGRKWAFTFDERGRRTSIKDPQDGMTFFEYDAAGNRVSVTDPLGNITQFEYDHLNRLVAEVDPLGNRTSHAYDGAGNLGELVDRNGRKRTFSYDASQRLLEEKWWNGDQLLRTISFSYDAAGNRTAVTDPESFQEAAYDALNRPVSILSAGTPGLPQVKLVYEYDGRGNVVSVEDEKAAVRSTYDKEDRLVARTWEGLLAKPAGAAWILDPRGNPKETRLFADATAGAPVLKTLQVRDAAGRLASLEHLLGSGTVLAGYTYTYDAAGRLIQESHHGETSGYTYDSLDQLLSASHTASPAESFAYDKGGNRAGGGIVVGAGNRILEDASFRYDYDAEGNLVRRAEKASGAFRRFQYDHRNRLAQVDDSDGLGSPLKQVRFVYDVQDRRIGKIVDGAASWSTHDRHHVWADYAGSGTEAARYLLGDKPDALVARSDGAGLSWYLTDHLGTVRDRSRENGLLTHHLDYDSFGRILGRSGPASTDRFAFTGRELDEELGFYHYRARSYDPTLGRFLSQDPLRFTQADLNLYRYVWNSPLNGTDPTGMVAAVERGVTNKTALVLIALITTATVTVAVAPAIEEFAQNTVDYVIQGFSESLGAQFNVTHALNAVLGLFPAVLSAAASPSGTASITTATFHSEAQIKKMKEVCWTCTAQCSGGAGGVTGVGFHETQAEACATAMEDANLKLYAVLNVPLFGNEMWTINEELAAKSCNAYCSSCVAIPCEF